jgi:hypothetical protein
MKIRQGFVSNSSSSSFIVGIARITDEIKLRKYLEDNNIQLGYDVGIVKVKDIQGRYEIIKTPNYVKVLSFSQDVSLPLDGLDEEDSIFFVNIINNEGDTGQFSRNKYHDIDYDIDLDYFDKNEQLLYGAFDNPNIGLDCKTSSVTFGAGRNG